MSFFKRHLRPIALLLAISFAGCSGSFLLGVQVFAWAKMTTQFMKHDAPRLALRKTFDDKHPCEICKHLREVRAKQASHPTAPAHRTPSSSEQNVLAKLSGTFITDSFSRNFKILSWFSTQNTSDSRVESPLTPPPKFTLVA